MKKKFFHFLLLAITVAGTGLISSCKDFEEDNFNDVRTTAASNYQEIINLLNAAKADYIQRDAVAAQVAQQNLDNAINALNDALKAKIKADSILAAQGITEAKNAAEVARKFAERDSLAIDQVEAAIDLLRQEWKDSLYIWSDSLKYAYDNATYARILAVADSAALVILNDVMLENDSILAAKDDSLQALIEDIQPKVDSLIQVAAAHQATLDSLANNDKLLQDSLDAVAAQVKANKDAIEALDERVDSIEDVLDDLQNQINKLFEAAKKRVTSIELQGAYNPVYGAFSLPAGIKSNLLLAYYGENGTSFKFPDTHTAQYVNDIYALKSADVTVLSQAGFSPETIAAGTILNDADDNAGKLYITVNPTTADLTGTEFTFENSVGDAAAVTISDLVPSTEKLTFGWTRAAVNGAAANGFYEAKVKIADPEAVRANVDQEQLKKVARDILNNRADFNLTNASMTLLQSVQDVLDAYAVKATWTDTLGTNSVYSNYGIGITSVKPISYGFDLSGVVSRRLPIITPLTGTSFSLASEAPIIASFTVNGITVPFSSHNIDFSTSTIWFDANGDNIQTADEIISLDGDLDDNLQAIVDQDIDDIRTSINNWIADLNTQITAMIGEVDGIVARANNTANNYIDKANSFISKYNRVANKLNSLFDNIGDKLQVNMVGEKADGTFVSLSNSPVFPTSIASNATVTLYPTSYTADLIAPAYKKFIGVTNVIHIATGKDLQSNLTSNALKQAAKAINIQDNINEVIDGNVYEIEVSNFKSGYIYEIFYAAADYSGKVSARKFYVMGE